MNSVSVLSPKEYKKYAEAINDIHRFNSALAFCESCDRRISESLVLSHLSVYQLMRLSEMLKDEEKIQFSQTAQTINRLIESSETTFVMQLWSQFKPSFI